MVVVAAVVDVVGNCIAVVVVVVVVVLVAVAVAGGCVGRCCCYWLWLRWLVVGGWLRW